MPLTAANVRFNALVEGVGWHTVIPEPDPGTSILLNKINVFNGTWAANWVIVKLVNTMSGESFLLFASTAWGALTQRSLPDRGKDGPIVFESGWHLEVYSSTVTVGLGGLEVDINYGIDTGYGDQPSDYHSHLTTCDAASGESTLPIVPPAPDDKIRHVKSIVASNYDSVAHPSWYGPRTSVGVDVQFTISMGSIASLQTVYFPFSGEGITVDEDYELWINKATVDTAAPVKVWCSWLEAGGYPDIGPSDTGPWTRTQQIIQRRSISLDGQQDRLQNYNATPPPASVFGPIGIADAFTILVWSRPMGWQTNTEWLFMLGGLSNSGAIHLSRNTQLSNSPYEIEIHEVSTTKKLYRWGGSLLIGYWECVAVTYDGSRAEPDKLQCWKNGNWYIWPAHTLTRVTDLAIGTLTDTNRYMGLGGAPTFSDTDGFYGHIWNAAAWSRVLSDAELQYLADPYNSHFDLRASHGPYVAGVDLEHYYRPGLMYSPNLGKDYGLGSNLLDLTLENSVTDANLIDDFPGKGLI